MTSLKYFLTLTALCVVGSCNLEAQSSVILYLENDVWMDTANSRVTSYVAVNSTWNVEYYYS